MANQSSPTILNIAHRGGGGLAPENSMKAFQKAIDLGVDGVELDVHLFHDELVVVHDDPVSAVRPTFDEVLELLRPSRLQLFAECKAIPKSYPDITARMLKMIDQFKMTGRSVFGSFDHSLVVEAKKISPGIRTCALTSTRIHEPGTYLKSIGADIYGPGMEVIGLRSVTREVNPAVMESCRKNGIGVWVYTVNEVTDMQKLIAADAQAIFTDFPDRLKTLCASS